MLVARLFGAMEVEVDGRRLPPPPGLRVRSLLAYLLLHPGLHDRAVLAPVFWPDVLDTSSRASLRSALWSLRGALEAIGAARYLRADRRRAGIAPDLSRDVDTERVDALLVRGDAAALAEATRLAGEPLLPQLADEWALVARDRYRERIAAALEGLGDAAEREGDLAAAVGWSRRAVGLDRLDEGAHRALVRRLALAGRRAEALSAYRRCAAALAAELGVTPSAETRALAASLRAGAGRAPAPPRRAAPPLIGRDATLQTLERAWRSARAGAGGVVALSGPAGIGKSRLALALAACARADGALCASGAGMELEGGIPFAPWVEAVSDLAPALPAPPPEAGWPADLARLSPAIEARLGRAPSTPAHAPELERARLFEATVQMLAWACGQAPLLLVLEDLHLADPASLALLAYLGRRLDPMPALVLVTRRVAVDNPALAEALEGLRRRGALLHDIGLGPLPASALARVVADAAPALGAPEAARAVELAEGNPLLAREAARAMAAGAEPSHGVRSAVRAPLTALPVGARLLVDSAAAAARPLSLGEAAVLVGAETLPEAIAAGVRAELLDPSAERQVRFTHALVREACYAEAGLARRTWLHARLAEVLAGRRASSAEVARHLRLAGDDARARDRLALAASEARALGALDAAVAYLREALELSAGEPLLAAELMLALAEVEAWRGRREAWDDAVAGALALLREAGDTPALAAAHVSRGGWLRTTICAPGEALAAYGEALALLERDGVDAPELRALALAGSAWAEAMAGDPARVEPLVAAVEAMPEAGSDALLHADLALARGAALVRTGRFGEAEERYGAAAELAEGAGRPDLALVARANAASAAACRGDFARTLELALPSGAGAAGAPVLEGFVLAARAYALSRTGRHAEAREVADGALALAERLGSAGQEALAAFDAGAVALAAGRRGAAARHLGRALAAEARTFPRPLARLLRAEALAEVDPDAAEAELERVPLEPVGPADFPDTLVARMARVEGLVAAARGDGALALRRLSEAEAGWRRRAARASGDAFAATLVDLGRPPVAGLVEPRLELVRVLSDRARVLLTLGRDEEAAEATGEAGRLAEDLAFTM